MAYKILLTSLYEAEKESPVRYFHVREGGKSLYCDAFLTVEASAKYVLGKYEIDEIITIGRRLTFDEGDDGRQIELREGKSFYTSDIKELSTYSLFRYRIAQYIDELRIEQQDMMDLLPPDEQRKIRDYVRDFSKSDETGGRFNRMFDLIARDRALYDRFMAGLNEIIPDEDAAARYRTWAKGYLYSTLKDSHKMEILEENEDVKVRFVPTTLSEDGKLPVDIILQLMNAIVEEHGDKIDIYVALNNDDMTDNYVLMNILDIIDTMHDSEVDVLRIYTTSDARNSLTGEIKDDTQGYGITELAAATRTFLKYGKADMLVEYWEKNGPRSEQIEHMIYAMRRIDVGLSLCNIKEMEDGLDTLRRLFKDSGNAPEPEDYYGKLFMVLAEGVKKDYGPLMQGDEIKFIDLVKWGFSKEFYQQTLTLIEARAPKEFIDKGLFYYCASEEEKERVLKILAEARLDMKPYEYWHLDDIDHYFIKMYIRKNSVKYGKEDPQLGYARLRMSYIGNTDETIITAHTVCDNRTVLENLLYSYYHIGQIRNHINHAEEQLGEDTRLIVEERDESLRYVMIKEALEFFIRNFDAAMSETVGKEFEVVKITSEEVKATARSMEKAMKYDKYEKDDRSDRNDRYDKSDRSDKNDKYDKSDRHDRSDRYGRSDRHDRYNKSDRYDRGDRPDRDNRADRDGDSGKSEESEKNEGEE